MRKSENTLQSAKVGIIVNFIIGFLTPTQNQMCLVFNGEGRG